METSFASPTGYMHLVRVGDLSMFMLVGTVSDERWTAMLAWGQRSLATCRGSLAYLPHGSVTPKQRQLAAAQRDGPTQRVCLITDSAVLRGTLTAYSWLKRGDVKYGAFAPSDTERALAWLGEVIQYDWVQARVTLRRFEQLAADSTLLSAAGG